MTAYHILYYSNSCNICKSLIIELAKYTQISNAINYICIDNRTKLNGDLYVILPNGRPMLLPSSITSVPTLCVVSEQQSRLFNTPTDIMQYLFTPMSMNTTKFAPNDQLPPHEQELGEYSAGGVGNEIDEAHELIQFEEEQPRGDTSQKLTSADMEEKIKERQTGRNPVDTLPKYGEVMAQRGLL